MKTLALLLCLFYLLMGLGFCVLSFVGCLMGDRVGMWMALGCAAVCYGGALYFYRGANP